jgi:hypothetical protein
MKLRFVFAALVFCLASLTARAQCTTFTPNVGFGLPIIGATSAWGTCLNTNFSTLDTLLGGVSTFPPNAATPSVKGYKNWVTANTIATTITNLTNPYPGQQINLLCADVNTTISSGGNFLLSSPSFSCASSTSISLVLSAGIWIEVGRGGGQSAGGAAAPAGCVQFNSLSSPGTFGCSHFSDSGTGTTDTLPLYIQGPTPWIDARTYGARPLHYNFNVPVSTATTTSGSPVASLASAGDFIPNDGAVVSKAGSATTQTTPAAPTVTPLGVVGTSTIAYKCVGADLLEGLTAASPAGSTTTGPTLFGNEPVLISSISRTSNVVTVNFSAPINAAANEHITIWNTTGAATSFNGIFLIASAPTSSQITFSQTGSNESPTLLSNSAGRLINGFVITSITRTNNVITVTTDENHNFVVGSAQFPTVVNIDGVQPIDLNGWYVIATVPAANQFTVNTGFSVGSNTETGSPWIATTTDGGYNWNTMGTFIWESNNVSCPTISAPTSFYYIYANYGSGTYNLIGATIPGQNVFRDWGPFLQTAQLGGAGNSVSYVPPPAAAVPATAPSSPQAQEFVGTIASIVGNTFTFNQNVPTAVSGQNIFHDNSLAIQAADNVACKADGGIVYFSGPSATNAQTNTYEYYGINAPMTIETTSSCSNVQWYLGDNLWVNDTITENYSGSFDLNKFGAGLQFPSFGQQSYANIFGNGNPMILAPGNYNVISANGILVQSENSGQMGIDSQGPYSNYENSYFISNGTSVGVLFGGGFYQYLRNIVFAGYPNYPNAWAPGGIGDVPDGQPIQGPPLGNFIVQDPASIQITGENSGIGKGIEFTSTLSGEEDFDSEIQNVQTLQEPWTPAVFVYGSQERNTIKIENVAVDSIENPTFAALGCGGCVNVTLENDYSNGGAVSGDQIRALTSQDELDGQTFMGQNIGTIRQNVTYSVAAGPYGATPQFSETQQMRPMVFPQFTNNAIMWEIEVTGVTATTSGSGTWTAGVHTACVLPVGWNGGDGGLASSPTNGNGGWNNTGFPTSCSNVTVNGSQGINISWNPLLGVQGYDVFVDGEKAQPSFLTTTSVTYSTYTPYGSIPELPGTGMPLIDQNQVASLLFRVGSQSGLFKSDITGTFTANRTVTLPDASGTIPLQVPAGTSLPSVASAVDVAGGGTVNIGPGSFVGVVSLPADGHCVNLWGQGEGVTIITVSSATSTPVISQPTGSTIAFGCSIRDLTIDMNFDSPQGLDLLYGTGWKIENVTFLHPANGATSEMSIGNASAGSTTFNGAHIRNLTCNNVTSDYPTPANRPANCLSTVTNATDNVIDFVLARNVSNAAVSDYGAANWIEHSHSYASNQSYAASYDVDTGGQAHIFGPDVDGPLLAGVNANGNYITIIDGKTTAYYAGTNAFFAKLASGKNDLSMIGNDISGVAAGGSTNPYSIVSGSYGVSIIGDYGNGTGSGLIPGTVYAAAGPALPTCGPLYVGKPDISVSDATSPTYMGTYTGGGTITTAVICSYNGSAYAWLTH